MNHEMRLAGLGEIQGSKSSGEEDPSLRDGHEEQRGAA